MNSLDILQLQNNSLSGTLPPEIGLGTLPIEVEFDFTNNANITGTVPESWAHFSSGLVWVRGTNVSGCIPDGLQYVQSTSRPLSWCSDAQRTDAATLAVLKQLLTTSGVGSAALQTWDANNTGEAGMLDKVPDHFQRMRGDIICRTGNCSCSHTLEAGSSQLFLPC